MGTPEEAKAMSLKAQAAINKMGREKSFAVFADKNGGFMEKDLYVFCVDMDGVLLFQPLKPELVGKNLYNFNKYGDLLFQNMIAVAKKTGTGWVDYKWPYPGTDGMPEPHQRSNTAALGRHCALRRCSVPVLRYTRRGSAGRRAASAW